MILAGICIAVGFGLLALTAILENTERGQRITARLLVRFLGEPEPAPPPVYVCCLRARHGRSEAGYWLHRVRDHGEGAACRLKSPSIPTA